MKSSAVPLRYFLILVLILLGIIIIDGMTGGSLKPIASMGNTLVIVMLILVAYTFGVSLIVRKIPDEASRFTAIRIFMIFLIAIGAFLALTVWIDEPSQIVLALSIVWGAAVISMRDLIQNVVGSLTLLITGIYRIGDRIRLRGVYGLVMDIGIFRTTLMELDHESGDRPTGEIITIPNGILFRETVTNTSRHISVISDEIRITLPFSADLMKARSALEETITRHTSEIRLRADREIGELSERKFLTGFETRPTINLLLSDWGIVLIAKYITVAEDRAAIKTRIVEDLSRHMPGIMEIKH
jgi:small-conductance mechanosensitive channel